MGLWHSEAIDTGFGAMITAADPASSTATSTANVNQFTGVIITLTAAGNAQTIGDPTNTTAGRRFTVVNNDTSTDNIDVNGITLEPGEAQQYIWDGSVWIPVEAVDAADITFVPAGDIAATNVQAALEELDTEKVAKETGKSLVADTEIAKIHSQNTDTGTTSTTFQIDSGNSGPKLKQDSGAVYARNAADNADAPVKAANFKTGTYTLTVDETKSMSDKANKDTDAVVGNLTQFTTGGDIVDSGIAASQVEWMFTAYDNGSQSGAVTLTPANGAMQKSAITANITGLTCALSATYPYIVWELTTDGSYTIDLTGYETDGGNAITLPDTGKCIITLSLSADGSTKHALLSATDMA